MSEEITKEKVDAMLNSTNPSVPPMPIVEEKLMKFSVQFSLHADEKEALDDIYECLRQLRKNHTPDIIQEQVFWRE